MKAAEYTDTFGLLKRKMTLSTFGDFMYGLNIMTAVGICMLKTPSEMTAAKKHITESGRRINRKLIERV